MNMERTSDVMQVLARTIDEFLNGDDRGKIEENKIGFALLVFPFGGPEGARTNWVSNGQRKDMLVALKEIIARFEGQAEQSGQA
jgi:hypothetical protein